MGWPVPPHRGQVLGIAMSPAWLQPSDPKAQHKPTGKQDTQFVLDPTSNSVSPSPRSFWQTRGTTFQAPQILKGCGGITTLWGWGAGRTWEQTGSLGQSLNHTQLKQWMPGDRTQVSRCKALAGTPVQSPFCFFCSFFSKVPGIQPWAWDETGK